MSARQLRASFSAPLSLESLSLSLCISFHPSIFSASSFSLSLLLSLYAVSFSSFFLLVSFSASFSVLSFCLSLCLSLSLPLSPSAGDPMSHVFPRKICAISAHISGQGIFKGIIVFAHFRPIPATRRGLVLLRFPLFRWYFGCFAAWSPEVIICPFRPRHYMLKGKKKKCKNGAMVRHVHTPLLGPLKGYCQEWGGRLYQSILPSIVFSPPALLLSYLFVLLGADMVNIT